MKSERATKRLILDVSVETMKRLEQLADLGKVTRGEILRQSLSIYNYIQAVKEKDPETLVLLDRGNEQISELILPGEDLD